MGWAVSLLIGTGGVLALPSMLLGEGRGLSYSNGFLPLLLLPLAVPVIRRAICEDRVFEVRPWLILGIAFAFSVCHCLGSRLEAEGYVDLGEAGLWISLPFLTLFFASLLGELWTVLSRYRCSDGRKKRDGVPEKRRVAASLCSRWDGLPETVKRLLVFLFLTAVWGIVLLAVYPGFFVYDAQEEFNQVAMRQFSTHHPLLHVLLLGGTVCAGNKLFGSYNAGIALFMVLQMAFLALVFTALLSFMKKRGASRILRGAALFYLTFFPVIQMYVLCSSKDTLYSAGMLMVMLLMAELAEDRERFFGTPVRPLFMAFALFFMAAMRHNGFYVLLLTIPVLVWMAGRGRRAGALCTGLAALFLYLSVTGGLQTVLQAKDTENQELLTVPIQQLARTWDLSPDSFTAEEQELLSAYLPREALEAYNPVLSDPVKWYFDNEAYREDPQAFWRLWVSVGCRAPGSYLNAWLLTSYGFWYPGAVIDVYQGNTVFTFTYGESSYFGYETELPGTRQSRIGWLEELFKKISLEISFQRIPLLSQLFSPGFLFWLYMLGAGFLLYTGEIKMLPVFLPAALNWLTVLCGPTFLVRYVLVFWFALPLLGYVVSRGNLCYTNTKTVSGSD